MSTYLLRAKRLYTFIFRVWFVDIFSSALGVSLPISIAIQESRLESIATYYETSSTRDGYVPRSQIIPWVGEEEKSVVRPWRAWSLRWQERCAEGRSCFQVVDEGGVGEE